MGAERMLSSPWPVELEHAVDPAWKGHFESLARFNRWESEQLRRRPADFGQALAWLSEAWELADRYGPGEDANVRRERHLREILQLRSALQRSHLHP